jgi:hypothetical protein
MNGGELKRTQFHQNSRFARFMGTFFAMVNTDMMDNVMRVFQDFSVG